MTSNYSNQHWFLSLHTATQREEEERGWEERKKLKYVKCEENVVWSENKMRVMICDIYIGFTSHCPPPNDEEKQAKNKKNTHSRVFHIIPPC